MIMKYAPLLTASENRDEFMAQFKEPEVLIGCDEVAAVNSNRYTVMLFRPDLIHYGQCIKPGDACTESGKLFGAITRTDDLQKMAAAGSNGSVDNYDVQYHPRQLFFGVVPNKKCTNKKMKYVSQEFINVPSAISGFIKISLDDIDKNWRHTGSDILRQGQIVDAVVDDDHSAKKEKKKKRKII